MKLLLDTQIFLWMNFETKRLTAIRDMIEDSSNQLFLSAASSWEITIKFGLGKLWLPEPPFTYVPSRMTVSGVTGLAIEHSHALAVADLPEHHRDPFDRVMIAQAKVENLRIVTADDVFSNYLDDIIVP